MLSGEGGKKEEKETKRKRFLRLLVIWGDNSKFSSASTNRNIKVMETPSYKHTPHAQVSIKTSIKIQYNTHSWQHSTTLFLIPFPSLPMLTTPDWGPAPHFHVSAKPWMQAGVHQEAKLNLSWCFSFSNPIVWRGLTLGLKQRKKCAEKRVILKLQRPRYRCESGVIAGCPIPVSQISCSW